jgi:hypothetical protein
MLLQLENTPKANIQKLFVFAKENSLQLSLVDADKTKTYLPGAALTAKETKKLIERSRKSGTVSMEAAHKQIRKKLNAR